jgi:ankyrin repeat protein
MTDINADEHVPETTELSDAVTNENDVVVDAASAQPHGHKRKHEDEGEDDDDDDDDDGDDDDDDDDGDDVDEFLLVDLAFACRWDEVLNLVKSGAVANVNFANWEGQTALWQAVQYGRADLAEALLLAGADVNQADDQGDAPLRVAPNAKIATMLIERGANLNAANNRGESALWWAARSGYEDVVEVLARAGADVNKADVEGVAPLSVAANATIATMLIEKGADVNMANRKGETALSLAAWNGRDDVVEALLQAGADVNKADKNHETPLIKAAWAGRWSVVTKLARSGRLEGVDTMINGMTALWRAVESDRADAVEALVQAGADMNKADKNGDAPLSVVKSAPIATILIERGANLNAANNRGGSALWLAAKNGREDFVELLARAGADVNKADNKGDAPLSVAANTNIATMLIERGANVNATNTRGESKMWWVARKCSEDLVEALAQAGADVNLADNKGNSPLTVATNATIATMLIERGADVNAANNRGQSVVWRAALCSREDVVEVLLRAGVDVNTADADGNAPLSAASSATIATMLIERGANVNATNKLGESALWQAVSRRREAVVEVLLRAGADVNEADNNGAAPLVPAARAGFWSIVMMLARSNRLANIDALIDDGKTALWLAVKSGSDEVVEALVKAGANVNIADKYGVVPLSVAANATIAKMLIEEGADVNAVNKRGESALLLAARNGRDDVVEVLLQAGADVNKADSGGYSPLSVAANATIATMIIERGVDVNAVNQSGQSALMLATMFNRVGVVEALVRAGADVSKADLSGNAPLIVAANATIAKTLIEQGAEVEAVNNRGETALWRAIHCQHLDVVEALVLAGADVDKADENGDAPLAYAVCRSKWPVVAILARSNLLDVDEEIWDDKTALWMALTETRTPEAAHKAAIALICAGADVDFWSDGMTLLHASTSARNMSLLLAAGAATAGVSAVDCGGDRDTIALMLAGGVAWADREIEQAIRHFSEFYSDDDSGNVDKRCMEIRSQVPAAKKRIELAGFAAIRARVLEICVALQEIEMPAPQLIEIVTHTCTPFAAQLPYHYLWDAVVLVKHFRKAK